jgi:hypothetical protein
LHWSKGEGGIEIIQHDLGADGCFFISTTSGGLTDDSILQLHMFSLLFSETMDVFSKKNR